MNWKPKDYQVRAIEKLLTNDCFGLFLDPGLGKTSITLTALKALKEAGKLKTGALVIAPLRPAYLVWPAENAKWSHLGMDVIVLHGKDKDSLYKQQADLYVINPEGLEWLFSKDKGRRRHWSALVIDESTRFKNWSAKRTKLLRGELDRFDRRYILTGTPAPNGIQDLFPQIYMLDGGRRLGRYITHFRSRYMIQVEVLSKSGFPMGVYKWEPKEGAVQDIESKLEDVILRLSAEDWLNLPPLIHNRIEVDLPKKAREQYEELEKEFILQLKKGTVTPANAGVLGMKLRQVSNGFVYTDGGGTAEIHTAKLDALEELVEECAGQPILVAIAYKHELEAIRARLGKHIPYLGGGVSSTEAAEICEEWNAGSLPIVIAHPTSVAHGLNLQGGRHICWFGLTWNLEEYDQFIRRVWRQGQTRRVICHTIVARGTMDGKIEGALRSKNSLQKALLDALA